MINEKVLLKLPLNFKNKCKIYPPSVKEVIGEDKFAQYKMMLTISQEELEDIFLGKDKNNFSIASMASAEELQVPTPLEFLLNNCYHDKEFLKVAKEAFYFFTKERVDFSFRDKKIFLKNLEEEILKMTSIEDYDKIPCLLEDEYFDFQNMIRLSLGEKMIEPPNPDEDPRIKRIKAKARYRDKIKAKKGLGLNVSMTLLSICCMGLGINLLNIGDISYAALSPLIRIYQEKEKYELDIDSLLAGADSKKVKPKYWVRNLDL